MLSSRFLCASTTTRAITPNAIQIGQDRAGTRNEAMLEMLDFHGTRIVPVDTDARAA
jgi:hypothetical protein